MGVSLGGASLSPRSATSFFYQKDHMYMYMYMYYTQLIYMYMYMYYIYANIHVHVYAYFITNFAKR